MHPLLLLCLCAGPAASQTAPAALNPAEARQAIDLLNDPVKRAVLTAQLQLLAKAQAQVAPKQAAAVPLAPNSLGAQLLQEGTSWLRSLPGQFVSFGRLLGNLPSVWQFTLLALADPSIQAWAAHTGWRLLLVLGIGWLAEFAVARALRRPVRAVAEAAVRHTGTAPVSAPVAESFAGEESVGEESVGEEGMPDAPPAARRAWRRLPLDGLIRLLRRAPYIFVCFLLDVAPLVVFLACALTGAFSVLTESGAVLQPVILAYGGWRLAICVTRLLLAPARPPLRLIGVSDTGAAYGLRWVRRIAGIAAAGVAASQTGVLFGMSAQAADSVMKADFLAVHVCLIVVVVQCRASVARWIRSPREKPGFGGMLRNRLASVWHVIAIFYIAALWLVWAAEVRNGYLRIWHVFVVTAVVVAVARLIRLGVMGALDRVWQLPPGHAEQYPGLERRAGRYLGWLRHTADAIIITLAVLCLLEAWGVGALSWFGRNALGGRMAGAVGTIGATALVAVVIWEAALTTLHRHMASLTDGGQVMKAARVRTLLPILRTVLLTALIGVCGLTSLSEIGVDVAPLLAGAGILGVAIGFGSQKLVQDFITGIFLLIENAMQVGDWVTVAGLSGTVENLSIRTMRLRAADGAVHIIPFSSVATVTNTNRGIGNAAVSVSVPVGEDSDKVCAILTAVAQEMRADVHFSALMRSELQLWGVDHIEAGAMTITGQIVCTDAGRWAVQREFNRRVNVAFKSAGIQFAMPVRRVVTVVEHAGDPARSA